MAIVLPLDKMSRKEKIEAMETLWDDLCQDPEGIEPPGWHDDVLKQRKERLLLGESRFTDWEIAKKSIQEECE